MSKPQTTSGRECSTSKHDPKHASCTTHEKPGQDKAAKKGDSCSTKEMSGQCGTVKKQPGCH